MRNKLLGVILIVGVLAFYVTPIAFAHPPAGYGNGNHDLAPHLHQTLTPFGPVQWYGNGPHDLRPPEQLAQARPEHRSTRALNSAARATIGHRGGVRSRAYSSS